jgi:hypothetical protein
MIKKKKTIEATDIEYYTLSMTKRQKTDQQQETPEYSKSESQSNNANL